MMHLQLLELAVFSVLTGTPAAAAPCPKPFSQIAPLGAAPPFSSDSKGLLGAAASAHERKSIRQQRHVRSGVVRMYHSLGCCHPPPRVNLVSQVLESACSGGIRCERGRHRSCRHGTRNLSSLHRVRLHRENGRSWHSADAVAGHAGCWRS